MKGYLHPASWEYGQAFDLAASALLAPNQPMLAVFSSPVHVVEWLKRCHLACDLASDGSFDMGEFVEAARPWAWGPMRAVDLYPTTGPYRAVLWAEPAKPSAARVAAALRALTGLSSELLVIASTWLRRGLPAWQQQPLPAVQPLSPGATLRVLTLEGWRGKSAVAFHGPRAIVWTRLAQGAQLLGRWDWSDRWLAHMRASYQEPGRLWRLAPVALIRARTT